MRLIRNTLLSATMLMGVSATQVYAQDVAVTAKDEGDEIVVTATRRATSLQDAPINISALSSQELSKQRIDDAKGLAAFTPGLTVAETGPRSAGTIIMRGISSSDAGSGANSNSAVGVYLGEVPLYLDFKLLDIARVEVLQGPQGTLYGLGTLSGAIRYMPNRPDSSDWSIDAHLRAFGQSQSKDAGINGDVTINVPIVQDHIAFRTVVGYYDNPGFIDYNYLLKQPGVSNPQPVRGTTAAQAGLGTAAQQAANFYSKKDLNYERTFTTRNQLLLELNPDAKLYLTYAHQQTKTGGTQTVQAGVLGTGRYESAKRYQEPVTRTSDLFAAEANVSLGFAQVVATSAWTKQTTDTFGDQTDLLLDLNYGYEAFPNYSAYTQSNNRTKQFNAELRLVSSHGGPFSWVIGGFYNNMRTGSNGKEVLPGYVAWYNSTRAGTIVPSTGLPRPPINRPDDLEYISFVNTQTKEKAVYGEGTFSITDKWQVTGGVRYFKYDAFAEGGTDTPLTASGQVRTPYPLAQIIPSRVRSGSTAADGFVWKANTSYKFSEDLMTYFTYSKGYRTGNVNRVAPCIIPLPAGQNVCALPSELAYQPDKTRNIELGVRASLLDKRLQLTGSVYHVKWTGLQVPSRTVNGAVGITVNGSSAVSKGVEFTARVKVTPNLSLQGNYSYTDAYLTADAPGLVVSQGKSYGAFAGDRLPGSSKHAGSAQVTYTQPLANGNEIEANWAVAYKGDVYSRIGLRGNGEVIPSYTTHRASITYRAEHFDFGIYADNIFNKYAITGISNDISSFNQVRNGIVERYYAQNILAPRRVGVDFRFRY
ncbi:TonB-dependent receptor [Novosphingobium sp. JCM 18896]|uniref:TonB-dependent receptor n=1 Tax=Novosphingobium sp. JCM 18896 TaxID=2989731 RepID=UPI002222E265|nr:TonB-dependent receptor [Novosphingobium sp. JCM 18896]MCW1430793.1 TonB-dependent receptor [Novosphingobium sp. JCM 18896]